MQVHQQKDLQHNPLLLQEAPGIGAALRTAFRLSFCFWVVTALGVAELHPLFNNVRHPHAKQ